MDKIAALFVRHNGPYYGLSGIEPWGLPEKDARDYNGPWPIIAHPPCKRWGRYWSGGPSSKIRYKLGDDDGCFKSALLSARKYGGIIEHPEASRAWKWFNIKKPPRNGGWIKGDAWGWTCCVEQGHYGHLARKATWLYFVTSTKPSDLIWGKSSAKIRADEGFHSTAERKLARTKGIKPRKRLTGLQRIDTPFSFRDLLISLVHDHHFRLG